MTDVILIILLVATGANTLLLMAIGSFLYRMAESVKNEENKPVLPSKTTSAKGNSGLIDL